MNQPIKLLVAGTGQIEWEEFADFMRQLKKSTNQEQMEEMIRAFKLFDHNNDNHIDASELKRVVTCMGDKLTTEEAEQMIRVADRDKDGRINYRGILSLVLLQLQRVCLFCFLVSSIITKVHLLAPSVITNVYFGLRTL